MTNLQALLHPTSWIAFLLAVLTACSCASPPPPEPPVRLIERVEGADVLWPRLQGAAPPEDLSLSPMGGVPKPGRASEVLMHDGPDNRELRVALLAPSGTAYRYHLRPPRAGVLRLGLGYALPQEADAGREIDYRVTVESADGEATLLLDETRTTEPHGGWLDRELSLAEWEGEDITLELATGATQDEGSAAEKPVWAAFGAPEVVSRELEEAGPDVILISLDTLRADHLSAYGYDRPTSPNLENLAEGGFRFAQAVSQSPWTRPSHWALFTGQYPVSHGEPRVRPLAMTLWRAGWRTGAVTGGGQVSHRFGFHRGFESYRISRWVRNLDDVTHWLDAAPGRRSFLFLHTFEIHDPYDHDLFAQDLPSGRITPGFKVEDWQKMRDGGLTDDERAYVEALYDSGIRYTDDRLGELFEALDARGLLDRAIIVVTSDHGEQFWEHGSWRHGSTVYDHQLLVPLIVHLPPDLRRQVAGSRWDPADGGRVIREQVRLIDLYPTLLDLLGFEPRPAFQGRSLKALLEGRETEEPLAFSENTNTGLERKALRSRRMKFIYSFNKNPKREDKDERYELYDLGHDPGEHHNLAEERPEVTQTLKSHVERIMRSAGGGDYEEEVPEGLDPELRRELEALGYFGGGNR